MEKHLDILFPPNYCAINSLKNDVIKRRATNKKRLRVKIRRVVRDFHPLVLDVFQILKWVIKKTHKKIYRRMLLQNSPLLAFRRVHLSLVIAVTVPLLSLFFWGCASHHYEAIVRPVEAIVIEKSTGESTKTFAGVVQAQEVSSLAFQVEGEILDFYVDSGDRVKKGQTLGRVDDSLYQIDIEQYKAQLDDAIIQHKNSKSYFGRIDMLHKEGGISDSQWDDAKTKMQSSEKQIQIASDKFEYAQKKHSYGTLKAPVNGIIVSRAAAIGDYAKPGQQIFVFQADGKTEIQAFVPQDYVDKIAIGQDAVVKITPIKDKTFAAKVRSIDQSNFGDLPYLAKLSLAQDYPRIKNGMSCSATFTFKEMEPQIKIPVNALLRGGNNYYVWVVEDIDLKESTGKAKKRIVKVGKLDSSEIPVISGLNEGDTLIVRGASEIQEGQKVKISGQGT